jgi:hypothetical protein
MLDRSSDLVNLMKKVNGGNMGNGSNIKKVQIVPKSNNTGNKSSIQPRKKCSSCSRKRKDK